MQTRPAYTLVEILLVLAVLAGLIGLAWPSAMRMMTDQSLRRGTEGLRKQLAAARERAIEEGVPVAIRVETNGHRGVTYPLEQTQSSDASLGTANSSAPAPTTGAGNSTDTITTIVTQWELDPSLKVVSSATSTDPVPEWVAETVGGGASTTWSGPLVFHSDGTASDATWTVLSDRGQQMTVTVRGLTGGLRVGQVGPIPTARELASASAAAARSGGP